MKLQLSALLAAFAAPAFGHGGHDHHGGHGYHGDHHHGMDHHQHHHNSMKDHSKSGGHHGDHNSLKPHTHIAFHHAESACAAEVESLCSPQMEVKSNLPDTLGDPFLDWIFLPQAAPPQEIEDVARVMDQMMTSIFEAPATRIEFHWIESGNNEQEAPHFLMDSTVAKLASEKEPEDIPQLAKQLQLYGESMMKQHDEDTVGHRMARRLTEMDTATIQHSVHLPFGCMKNRCLMDSMNEGLVSDECTRAVHQLQSTYLLEEELERRQEAFIGMMWIYMFLLTILMSLVVRKFKARRGQREKTQRIIQAIYSNPQLKQQIELELGEPLGSVPPLPSGALRMMSKGGKDLKRRLKCMRLVHKIFFLALLSLVVIAPFWVLPACIVISFVRVCHLCLISGPKEDDCECCCCGGSARAAADGTLTKEQECCGCCKGTGVCAPACSDCCGDDGCCCCDGGCSDGCCDTNKKPKKTVVAVEDCECCCCGGSKLAAMNGTLTKEQECCGCCKGTGVCSAGCADCCGDDGCCCCDGGCDDGCCDANKKPKKNGRGQKHVVHSKEEIYSGVPLQVV